MVTVALDVRPEDTHRWIDVASPSHPSLIDTTHVTGELFGFSNIPMALWIDETGTIVRPASFAGTALSTAVAADPPLLTRDGDVFRLSSLRGRKVVLVAWSTY